MGQGENECEAVLNAVLAALNRDQLEGILSKFRLQLRAQTLAPRIGAHAAAVVQSVLVSRHCESKHDMSILSYEENSKQASRRPVGTIHDGEARDLAEDTPSTATETKPHAGEHNRSGDQSGLHHSSDPSVGVERYPKRERSDTEHDAPAEEVKAARCPESLKTGKELISKDTVNLISFDEVGFLPA